MLTRRETSDRHVFVHSRREIGVPDGDVHNRDATGVFYLTFSTTAVSKGQNRAAMYKNVRLIGRPTQVNSYPQI